jgi:hypothetical protein
MAHPALFSADYATARRRLVEAAVAAGFRHEAWTVGDDPDHGPLTIDALWRGAERPRRVAVVSSGLHGVEGFLGSAIQLGALDALATHPVPDDGAILVLHALNPYGFARIRRVDQDNIDLNRNFLRPGEAWSGAPPMYGRFDPFFNPKSPPSGPVGFYGGAVGLLARHGLVALKDTLPVGQYDFPLGLFFGGRGPSVLMKRLDAELPRFVGSASSVVHVDFHTGIGVWGGYKLFTNRDVADPKVGWLRSRFGDDAIEAWDPTKTSYTIRGGLGTWLAARFPSTSYDELTCEFGTYHVLRIVRALREENREHHHGRGDAPDLPAKRRMMEAFAPASPEWRTRCVEQGLGVVGQTLRAAFE